MPMPMHMHMPIPMHMHMPIPMHMHKPMPMHMPMHAYAYGYFQGKIFFTKNRYFFHNFF